MIPYRSDSSCSNLNENFGIGYHFSVGECFALTTLAFGNSYFQVSVSTDLSTTTITQFKSRNEGLCSGEISNTISTFNNGSCIKVPNYTDNELVLENGGNYILVNIYESTLYSLNLISTPTFDGYKVSTYGDPECESDPYFYYYYTNGTLFNNQPSQNENTLIYCDQDIPYERVCQGSHCKTSSLSSGCSRDFKHFSELNWIWYTC